MELNQKEDTIYKTYIEEITSEMEIPLGVYEKVFFTIAWYTKRRFLP